MQNWKSPQESYLSQTKRTGNSKGEDWPTAWLFLFTITWSLWKVTPGYPKMQKEDILKEVIVNHFTFCILPSHKQGVSGHLVNSLGEWRLAQLYIPQQSSKQYFMGRCERRHSKNGSFNKSNTWVYNFLKPVQGASDEPEREWSPWVKHLETCASQTCRLCKSLLLESEQGVLIKTLGDNFSKEINLAFQEKTDNIYCWW